MTELAPVTPAIRQAAVNHYKHIQSMLGSKASPKQTQERTINELRSGKWDKDEAVQAFARIAIGVLPEVEEPDEDVKIVRAVLHAYQRSLPSPDSGWGNMSYLIGSYDNTKGFQAALAAFKKEMENVG